jgi:hypothetical protein
MWVQSSALSAGVPARNAASVETDRSELAAARRRWLVALGLLHSPAMTVVLAAL